MENLEVQRRVHATHEISLSSLFYILERPTPTWTLCHELLSIPLTFHISSTFSGCTFAAESTYIFQIQFKAFHTHKLTYIHPTHSPFFHANDTYSFSYNFRVSLDVNCDLEKHPCPLVTAQTISNICNANLLISGGFNPVFATINWYVHSLYSPPTSCHGITTNGNLTYIWRSLRYMLSAKRLEARIRKNYWHYHHYSLGKKLGQRWNLDYKYARRTVGTNGCDNMSRVVSSQFHE